MRFLVDQPLSWRIASDLRQDGHDAVHVRDCGLSSASDAEILAYAIAESRTIITQDSDFGALLSAATERPVSVILFRQRHVVPAQQSRLVHDSLEQLRADLEAGAVVVFGDASLRVHRFTLED